MPRFASAAAIADDVRSGRTSATALARAALAGIAACEGRLNAFTAVFEADALRQAEALDRARAAGDALGPLAGVPFAVKNLFDVEGRTTLAGAKIRIGGPVAAADAELVARLKRAGAVLVGALNMDEFAYGFVTENAHFGTTRNPHDLDRIAGGSSGGSAAAVAAGLLPLALGSDTNGSIRIPAGLCGVFGLKPSHGRLPVQGMFPFVPTLDHAGVFARSVGDLALAYDAGLDDQEERILSRLETLGAQPLRVGVLGGWFARELTDAAGAAVAAAARALGAERDIILAGAEAARSAAFCLTAFEGGRLHLPELARRACDYDPAVGARLLAGALSPEPVRQAAEAFRRSFAQAAAETFERFEVLIAPIVPGPAPLIGQETMRLGGADISVRRHLGLYTQPVSFIGAPVIAAPIDVPGLPVGVQIIAAPGRDDLVFAAALQLERQGLARAPRPLATFAAAPVEGEALLNDHQ
jgi:aspartyl-tRNA(Asn)/glutamyl-tRNA(Gln) amidotransferase subunit A